MYLMLPLSLDCPCLMYLMLPLSLDCPCLMSYVPDVAFVSRLIVLMSYVPDVAFVSGLIVHVLCT